MKGRVPALVTASVVSLAIYVWVVGLDEADKLASVIGAFVALAGLAVSVYGLVVRRDDLRPDHPLSWLLPTGRSRVRDIAWAEEELAAVVRSQWDHEANLRQLRDAQPLTVRWTSVDSGLMDHPDVIVPGSRRLGNQSLRRLYQARGIEQMVQKFAELPRRRLVVVGAPGSGKTCVLMLLALALLEDWRPGRPVPVLLSTTSWNPQEESFWAWLIRHLRAEYPFLRGFVDNLVTPERVLPILDGLDELPQSSVPAALEAINQAGVRWPLVVACRTYEFEQAVRQLDVITGAAVAEIEPVAPREAKEYLRRATPPGERLTRWEPVFKRLRQGSDDPLVPVFQPH